MGCFLCIPATQLSLGIIIGRGGYPPPPFFVHKTADAVPPLFRVRHHISVCVYPSVAAYLSIYLSMQGGQQCARTVYVQCMYGVYNMYVCTHPCC